MKDLNKIPDKNPFKVPENYFEEVNRKIISATSGNEQEFKKPGIYRSLKPQFLIAASVTGFIIISYTALKLLTPEKINIPLAEVRFEQYSESDLDDIDLTSLEETTVSMDFPEEGPDVNKTDIIDYLLLENIEISDIYQQL
jgi:hypothetical protein